MALLQRKITIDTEREAQRHMPRRELHATARAPSARYTASARTFKTKGSLVRRLFGIALAMACTWVALPAHSADAEPDYDRACRLTLHATLDLETAPNGVTLVPISFNGTDAWMILSTAMPFSLVTDASMTAFNLKRESISGKAGLQVYGKPLTDTVTIRSLNLGGVTFQNSVMMVEPRKDTERPPVLFGRPVIGNLGLDVFSHFDFELNLADGKLLIFSENHCPGAGVYWTRNFSAMPFDRDWLGNLYFPLELDGKFVEATLSTQSVVSTIDSEVTLKVYGFDEHSPEVLPDKSPGAEKTSFRAMSLTAPGLSINNARIKLVHRTGTCSQQTRTTNRVPAIGYSDCPGSFPLYLGRNVLEKLRIYVATKDKMIYFSRADAN